jgi:nucleotide-binding universal stress UspA family protein
MFKKILVPLDGSALAEKALPYARTLAQKFGGTLLLAQVLPPFVLLPPNDQAAQEQLTYLKNAEVTARRYLAHLQANLQESGLSATIEVLEGGPVAEMILELARDRAVDVIVMNTHGYTGNELWVYGSVTNKVLQQAPCPIFLVRTKREA